MTTDWRKAYGALIAGLPDLVSRARLTLCGFSACVDVYLSLHDVDGVAAAAEGTPAAALLAELKRRATTGIGGELRAEWPDGPCWFPRHLTGRLGLGGTSAQAAQLLATLGAPALLALADRSFEQLEVIHPGVQLAAAGGLVRRSEIRPSGSGEPPHIIFEFTAGRTVDGVPIGRSSRVIVRFNDSDLQHDGDFDRLSVELAGSAGAGILSGFNELPPARTKAEHDFVLRTAEAWRARGLGTIHLELGDFHTEAMRDEALAALAPAATSFGASLSELDGLIPATDPVAARAIALAERFGFSRVCIHADHWALAVTRGDPEIETTALLTGCLVAAARAAVGQIVVPQSIPEGAELNPLPFPAKQRLGDWHVVAVPSPYLARPVATIGLGDTFLAGTLLVLGADAGGRGKLKPVIPAQAGTQ
jgi:ADP-dependent phosphofructokinase/glucokinase